MCLLGNLISVNHIDTCMTFIMRNFTDNENQKLYVQSNLSYVTTQGNIEILLLQTCLM